MRLFLILAVLALAACAPVAQRMKSAEAPGYASDAWPDQLRARTQRQNESGRIY